MVRLQDADAPRPVGRVSLFQYPNKLLIPYYGVASVSWSEDKLPGSSHCCVVTNLFALRHRVKLVGGRGELSARSEIRLSAARPSRELIDSKHQP